MKADEPSAPAEVRAGRTRRRRGRLLLGGAGLLTAYLLTAYVVLPLIWRTDLKRHPGLSSGPRITHTAIGIHGDPVNLAIIGSESELVQAMTAAKWYPADPITLRTSIRIAVDSVLRHPDDEAPVSDLFLFGRKQDLAFEQPVGDSPRQRHHVRFWLWDRQEDGRPVWFGAATFDESVGLSYTTGQITHHIRPDVDAERDRILSQLQKASLTSEVYSMPGFHTEQNGKNGGGDPWHTDGRLGVAVLAVSTNAPGGAVKP